MPSAEFTAAEFLHRTFGRETYLDERRQFDLRECKYFIQEAVAEAYIAEAAITEQADIMTTVVWQLQRNGRNAVAETLFGSPLHGVKKMRELVTREVCKRIHRAVNAQVKRLLDQEGLSCESE